MPAREINLLPRQRVTALRQQSAARAIGSLLKLLVWGQVGMLLVAIIAFGTLMWSARTADMQAQAPLAQDLARYQAQRQALDEHQLFLEKVARVSNQRVVWSEFLALARPQLPPGTRLTAMTGAQVLSHAAVDGMHLTVRGQASSRAAVTTLEQKLRELPRVARVEAPRTNLLERTNPRFELRVIFDDAEGRHDKLQSEL